MTELGFAGARVETIETDDPDGLDEALRGIGSLDPTLKPATFVPTGNKREVMRLALRELHAAAPARLILCRFRKAHHSVPSKSSRRLHTVPFLRVGVPDRRAIR